MVRKSRGRFRCRRRRAEPRRTSRDARTALGGRTPPKTASHAGEELTLRSASTVGAATLATANVLRIPWVCCTDRWRAVLTGRAAPAFDASECAQRPHALAGQQAIGRRFTAPPLRMASEPVQDDDDRATAHAVRRPHGSFYCGGGSAAAEARSTLRRVHTNRLVVATRRIPMGSMTAHPAA